MFQKAMEKNRQSLKNKAVVLSLTFSVFLALLKSLTVENGEDDEVIGQFINEISFIKNELMDKSDFNSEILSKDEFIKAYNLYEEYKEQVKYIIDRMHNGTKKCLFLHFDCIFAIMFLYLRTSTRFLCLFRANFTFRRGVIL